MVSVERRRQLVSVEYALGKSDQAIADKIGCSRETIRNDRLVLQIPTSPHCTAFKSERHRIGAYAVYSRSSSNGPDQFTIGASLKGAKLGWLGIPGAAAAILTTLRSTTKTVAEIACELRRSYRHIARAVRQLRDEGLVVETTRTSAGRRGGPRIVYDLTAAARKIYSSRLPSVHSIRPKYRPKVYTCHTG